MAASVSPAAAATGGEELSGCYSGQALLGCKVTSGLAHDIIALAVSRSPYFSCFANGHPEQTKQVTSPVYIVTGKA